MTISLEALVERARRRAEDTGDSKMFVTIEEARALRSAKTSRTLRPSRLNSEAPWCVTIFYDGYGFVFSTDKEADLDFLGLPKN
ncbi:MAG TPA: hypothetical protein VMC43_02195 [Candidatus Paceibacterota bacterium]|nr:hypothetical protein [Candidatus Paceibacterota bacterium]